MKIKLLCDEEECMIIKEIINESVEVKIENVESKEVDYIKRNGKEIRKVNLGNKVLIEKEM
jgi:hypothetical protein